MDILANIVPQLLYQFFCKIFYQYIQIVSVIIIFMCIAKLSNNSVNNQNHHETACIYWGK